MEMETDITVKNTPVIKQLGVQEYTQVWQSMRDFTINRTADTPDELWFVEHPPVFTQGQNGKPEHILQHSEIPIVQTDRGGQITYHGPGQLVVYPLFDLRRLNMGPRAMVCLLEKTCIALLAHFGIEAYGDDDARGVYVNKAKIASIGLRIKKGCSYHGLSLNVDMDMTPFQFINPCGYQNLKMTQIAELLKKPVTVEEVIELFRNIIIANLLTSSPT